MGNEKLLKAGLKTTIQRTAILEFLESSTEHPSAEMVYLHINKIYPSITLSTVYNTLEVFVEKKIVTKVFSLDGKARYDAQMYKHHHLYINETGEIIDIFDEDLNKIMTDYLNKNKISGFSIDDFHIEFTGKKQIINT
jgi:Fur family transcriptional regulator, peroxide stress response regulator